jgi:GT2 family glycosyltransferase
VTPSLSIVVPSHNQPGLLQLCLQSLVEHSPERTEILVVDDGSKSAVISEVASAFRDVIILRNDRALGFCRAANAGIARASGDVIELLNDDAQVTAGWATGPLRSFAADPQIGAVAPLVLQGPTHGVPKIDSAGDLYDLGGFAGKRGHGRAVTAEYLETCEIFGASASSAFYRGDLLKRLGGFPAGFGSYFEDVDLSWRIRHAGYRIVYEPTSRVWHRVGSSYRKRRTLIERQSLNEERVFWRNVPDVWRSLPRHLAVLAGKSVRRIREGSFLPFAFGRLRMLAEITATSRHRREVLSRGRRESLFPAADTEIRSRVPSP